MEDNLQEVIYRRNTCKEIWSNRYWLLPASPMRNENPSGLDTIAKEVLKLIRSTIPTTIEIKENIESRSLIMGNPSQVHQLLMNLCTNAAQAMEDTGGILEIGLTDVEHSDRSPLSTYRSLKSGNYIENNRIRYRSGHFTGYHRLYFRTVFYDQGCW